MFARVRRVVGVVAVVLVAATACRDGGGAPPAAVPEISAAQAGLLWDAEQVLLRDCMARQGFKYWVVARNPIAEDREFPYAVTDPAWAARHGYGADIRRRIVRLREDEPNRRYLDALPAERRRAAFIAINGAGPRSGARERLPDELEARLPSGGVVRRSAVSCTSTAQGRLYGDLPTWYRVTKVVAALPSIRRARVVKEPRFTAAVSAWSTCMKGRGHPYATPDDARGQAGSNAVARPSKLSTRREIRTAVAEAECARTTGLAEVARELDERHDKALTAEYRAEVMTERRMQRAALPRAARITAAR